MPTPRSPNVDKRSDERKQAEKIYLESKGSLKLVEIAEKLKAKLQTELEKDGDFRALGQDLSWLNKVRWTAPQETGSWQEWTSNNKNSN